MWLLYNVLSNFRHLLNLLILTPLNIYRMFLGGKCDLRVISNTRDCKTALVEEWGKISPALTKELVDSMPRGLQEVIRSKGNPNSRPIENVHIVRVHEYFFVVLFTMGL